MKTRERLYYNCRKTFGKKTKLVGHKSTKIKDNGGSCQRKKNEVLKTPKEIRQKIAIHPPSGFYCIFLSLYNNQTTTIRK